MSELESNGPSNHDGNRSIWQRMFIPFPLIALLCTMVVVIAIAFLYLAFWYQPIEFVGTSGFGKNIVNSDQSRSYTNDVTLRDSGISTVKIVEIAQASSTYPLTAWRVGTVEICNFKEQGNLTCPGGNSISQAGAHSEPFRPIDIQKGKTVDFLWHMTYACGRVTTTVDMRIPVTIHYLGLFNKTINLNVLTFAPACK